MTYKILKDLIEANNISEDVEMLSDSGWECGATDMDVVWYCEDENRMIFTQSSFPQDYTIYENYKCIYGRKQILYSKLDNDYIDYANNKLGDK